MTLEINADMLVAYACIFIGGFLVGLGLRYLGKVQDPIGVIYSLGIGGVVTIVGVITLLTEMEIIKFV